MDQPEALSSSESSSENSRDSTSSLFQSCPICLNKIDDQKSANPANCNHFFCLNCITEWSNVTNSCPIDRIPFKLILVKNRSTDRIIRKVKVKDKANENDEIFDGDMTFCEQCGQANREYSLLLCDGCDKGFHLDCLNPPLQEIPDGEWFCQHCVPRFKQRIARTIRAQTRRALPRTRAVERVRNRIAGIYGYVEESSDQSETDQSEEDEEESIVSGEDSDEAHAILCSLIDADRAVSVSPSTSRGERKNNVARGRYRRRRTRRRKTKKRKTIKRKTTSAATKSIKSSNKPTSKKPDYPKTKRRKRRKTRRRRKVKRSIPTGRRRTFSDSEIAGNRPSTSYDNTVVKSVKKRLANVLGIVPPRKNFETADIVPKLWEPKRTNIVSMPGPSFSILGNNYDILHFDDESDSDDESKQSDIPSLSEKAKKFDHPIKRIKPASNFIRFLLKNTSSKVDFCPKVILFL